MSDFGKCSVCGEERKVGMFTLVSDMCDECYNKEGYGSSTQADNKRFTEAVFTMDVSKFTFIDFLMKYDEFDSAICDQIVSEGKAEGHLIAVIIRNTSPGSTSVVKDIYPYVLRGESVTIKYSYFFADSRFDDQPTYEDSKQDVSKRIIE